MTPSVELRSLSVHFGELAAVDDVSLTLPGGTITGLLGRNGAGKSTLLSTVAGYRRPSAGQVLVDGRAPFEDAWLMSETCLVREGGDLDDSMPVAEVLQIAAALRGRWDQAFADRLVERFSLPLDAKVRTLSKGMASALSVTVGLASRAPLTMFDEPHVGMDAPSREAFYEELLADYVAHPRTVVLSTHLIDEAASLFEQVVVLHHGRLLAHEATDELLARGAELTGPAEAVDAVAAGQRVVHERRLGPTKAVVVVEPLDDAARQAAAARGVAVGPLPLQDLFIRLTSEGATP